VALQRLRRRCGGGGAAPSSSRELEAELSTPNTRELLTRPKSPADISVQEESQWATIAGCLKTMFSWSRKKGYGSLR